MPKIDCHTHIVSEAIRESYFSQVNNYAIVLAFLEAFENIVEKCDAVATVVNEKRLFLCPCIDIHGDIPSQLAQIERQLYNIPIVGLKIYLTYQSGRADDERMLPIYEFASKHRLTITYHTGSCALVLPSDNDLAGSDAKYVQRVARRYPDVNFVVAHMDDPRYDECARIVDETDNMFTDVSGAYEPGTPEGDDISWAIDTFRRAISPYPQLYKKILYGTDYCPPINLFALDEYDRTVEALFPAEQHQDIYYNNALRAFPRLAAYLKGERS